MFDEFPNEMKPIRDIFHSKVYEQVDKLELYNSIFDGCKVLVEDDLETYICSDINIEIFNGYVMNIQVSVSKDDIPIMLEKVMEFYIQEELYEKCSEVKEFQSGLSDELE